ncbi:hypothetical protein CIP107538_01693 [Corynebacterium diphtheriae]|nr:hypothetical protein CIP107538_01693 [Corynebacterium diphtheriae]CAB0701009.1 hypothetical protein FRC0061_01480 [Corynebacterium diphtheriae]CAB0726524.1 hypothetical protein FRC0086_01264 [Corynebacterium diphtheriae]CAB0882791.1 hypothetical protein FRC0406_01534 [Corynebacterium diphtheriae]CAB0930954.1 hypothetical protein FRC0432_01607 [Corynebacterium diphtheriae]
MSESSGSATEQELRIKEIRAARFVHVGRIQWLLIGAWTLFAVGLVLPHSGNAQGWQVLTFSSAAAGSGVKLAEYIFVLIGFIAAIVCNLFLILTRRTVAANIGFLLSGIALLMSLFAMWMRLQSKENEGFSGIGIGFGIEILAVVVLVYALSALVFSKSQEQRQIEHLRATTEVTDEVARVQRDLQNQRRGENNPLLVDNRRRQAAEKRRSK